MQYSNLLRKGQEGRPNYYMVYIFAHDCFFGNYSSFPGRGTLTCPGLDPRVRAGGPCPDSGDLLSITKTVILETYARNAGKCIA